MQSVSGSSNSSAPFLGGALGPMMKTILETSAMMPMLKDVMKLAGSGDFGETIGTPPLRPR